MTRTMLRSRSSRKGLKKLGLLKGTLPRLIKDGAYREFYMHRTGHWLGMDVHDVGDYKIGDEWRIARTRHGHDRRTGNLPAGG